MNMKINHLAVWVCVIVLHLIGFLWYTALFGDAWADLAGVDPETAEATAMHWISNAIAIIAPLYVLAWLFTKMNVNTWMEGATIAFLITFSFVLLSFITSDMFAGVPYKLSWINGGQGLVAMTIAGAILGAWTKKA